MKVLTVFYTDPFTAARTTIDNPNMKSSSTNENFTGGIQEAPVFSLVAICIAATGTFLMFFYAGNLAEMLAPLASSVTKP